MLKAKNVLDYYMDHYKNITIPSRNSGDERYESVAETVVCAELLAIVFKSELDELYKDIDLGQVLFMLVSGIYVNNFKDEEYIKMQNNIEFAIMCYNCALVSTSANKLTHYNDNDLTEKTIKILNAYNKLKSIARKGLVDWHVKTDRNISIAEHTYKVQNLAIAMKMNYPEEFKNINIYDSLITLTIHDIGESIINDITPFDSNVSDKATQEKEAMEYILSDLKMGKYLLKLFNEHNNRENKDVFDRDYFDYFCDKTDGDLEARVSDEICPIDLTNQEDNRAFHHPFVQELLAEFKDEEYAFSKMWLKYGQVKYKYTEPFMEVSLYASNNKIYDNVTKTR